MIDKIIQPYTQPFLKIISKILIKFITPNQVSLVGFISGLVMCAFIILDFYLYALVALILNRFLDGLDGTMARLTTPTPFGGYIDIVFDFIIYGGFVLSFGLTNNTFITSACLLLFLYIGTSSTFLAYAALLKNYNPKFENKNSKKINKGFYYTSGLVEGFETIVFMILCLLAPEFFNIFAILFSMFCLVTIVSRVFISYKRFKQ
ncbi:CDP-alcohol phosphatidyltransferase family protein [Alphaproteobacteria bacterium]|nr:CDP-alcohol phosphatidyltransferase family protein [Alphaproteobacteria bacterium]